MSSTQLSCAAMLLYTAPPVCGGLITSRSVAVAHINMSGDDGGQLPELLSRQSLTPHFFALQTGQYWQAQPFPMRLS